MTNSMPVVLAISVSPKPGKSASRALLRAAVDQLSQVYPVVKVFDLCLKPIPIFDGRAASHHPDENVQELLNMVRESSGLLLAIPCYWGDVSGAFKNMIDLLCGARYNTEVDRTILGGKMVGGILVGADENSADAGLTSLRRILDAVGAELVEPVTVIGDPRSASHQDLFRRVTSTAGELARHCVLRARRND